MAGAALGVAATFNVGASSVVDVIPPVGESWVIGDWSCSSSGAGLHKIGAAGATANNYGATSRTARVVFTNTAYMRFAGGSGGGIFAYGGVKVVGGVAAVASVASFSNWDIIPPVGETWMLTDYLCAGGGSAAMHKVGAGGVTSQTYGVTESEVKMFITNTTYARINGGTSGGVSTYGGVKV
jgi:hypothetical protein